jgi:hypothetical protein
MLRISKALIFVTVISCVTRGSAADAQQLTNVRVFRESVNNVVIYDYRLFNNTGRPVVALIIGRVRYDADGQLQTAPKGWNFDKGVNTGSIGTPLGWNGDIGTTEESKLLDVQWKSNGTTYYLQSGSSLSGFRIALAATDDSYITSGWTLILSDGTTVSGPLEPDSSFVSGDLNGDGKVDCADVAIVRASFGLKIGQPGFDSRADVDLDGVVDIRDLAFVTQKLPARTRCP